MVRISAALLLHALLSTLPGGEAQSGTGIIGFGISFWQDLCCQACYDSLSALYLTCTTFSDDDSDMDGMNMGSDGDMAMGTTSEACRVSNTPWLQTMAYCIHSNCDAVHYSAEDQAKCFSVHAVDGASEPTFQESLPSTAPTVELDADAMWLNVTSLVNSDLYYSTYGSEGNFAASEYYHTRYAMVIYLTTIGVVVACGVLAQARGAFPGFQKRLQTSSPWLKLQQHLFLPALFGTRRHEAVLGNAGYVPSRPLGIFIAVYIILNVVLSSVSFDTFTPNIFWNSSQFALCEYVGNRTGTLSLVNLSIAILFAGRNNLLIAMTGWNQTAFLIFHRWAARVATLQAVVHSIVYTLAYFEPGYDGALAYAAEAVMPFYRWGIVATIAFCLAVAFAILPIRTKFYEVFLAVHIVLAIVGLIGCWYHLVPHFGFIYGYQTWLYICFAFWAFDRIARVARILFYNRLGGLQATVEAVPGSSIVHVTVFPRAWSFGPGQHSYLYFPNLGWGKGWESHPFSVAAWNRQEQQPSLLSSDAKGGGKGGSKDDARDAAEKLDGAQMTSRNLSSPASSTTPGGPPESRSRWGQHQHRPSIEFLVRTHSGMTTWLRDHTALAPGRSLALSAYTEGPYAGHRASLQPLCSADTVLCVIGGIGITHALGFLQEYTDTRRRGSVIPKERHRVMGRATRFILAWSAREMALLQHVRERFLKPAAEVDGLEYLLRCTDPGLATTPQSAAAESNDEPQDSARPSPSLGGDVMLGRMKVGSVIRSSLEASRLTTVVVCGPGKMADETIQEIVKCVRDGYRVDVIEEAYGW